MTNSVIVITGGAQGIGAKLADHLARGGHRLALCDREEAELRDVAARLSADHGVDAAPFVCDVSDPDRVGQAVEEILTWAGQLDVLINNAGILGARDPIEDLSPELWQRPIEVNLFGTVNFSRAVLPQMKRQGHGKIINFAGAGIGWKEVEPFHTGYVTSKFAVYGFTQALAQDLRGTGIQVNIISPGSVETALWDGVAPERRVELKKPGQDLSGTAVKDLVSFLISDASGPLTGKLLSAGWDKTDDIVRNMDQVNSSGQFTIRRIDGRNFAEV